MKSIKQIQTFIQSIPRGEPFTAKMLLKFGSRANVDQVLSRMTKMETIIRVTRGIYVRPEKSRYVGTVLPEPEKIIETIAETTGSTIQIHGAEAARRLQLSTQAPTQVVFYTSGTSRQLKIGHLQIQLKHASPSKLVSPGTTVGLVISALRYLGKTQVNANIIQKVKNRISSKEFAQVKEAIPTMPSWMANAFYYYEKEKYHEKKSKGSSLDSLKKS